MNASDAALVLKLYQHDYIQVLVATYDLCWTLHLPAHLVIVMGMFAFTTTSIFNYYLLFIIYYLSFIIYYVLCIMYYVL